MNSLQPRGISESWAHGETESRWYKNTFLSVTLYGIAREQHFMKMQGGPFISRLSVNLSCLNLLNCKMGDASVP